MRLRGISGVVIAVLLTVIGIAAVLMFWGMFSGLFTATPKLIIEQASAVKVGNNQYEFTIRVREVGGASTTITKLVINIDGQEQQLTPKGQTDLSIGAGESKTIAATFGQSLDPGKTYYIRVYYKKGSGEEPTDLYPITVR